MLFDLFKRKKREGSDSSEYSAPGTEIRYSPDLIDQLLAEHKELLKIFSDIQKSFEEGDYRRTSKFLSQFRSALQSHLLTENIRLYVYLEHALACDDMNYELMRDLRREMEGIGRSAMNFLRKYEAIGVDRDLAAHFAKDLETVGSILTQRIQKEEKVLYPLYVQHY